MAAALVEELLVLVMMAPEKRTCSFPEEWLLQQPSWWGDGLATYFQNKLNARRFKDTNNNDYDDNDYDGAKDCITIDSDVVVQYE